MGKAITTLEHEFYGYELIQNPSNVKLHLYVAGVDAQVLRDIVSVDNAVKWDSASGLWRAGGRNRTISDQHWESIRDFLHSSNQERILPSAIVISIDEDAFDFEPHSKMAPISNVVPGVVKLKGRYESGSAPLVPVEESDRTAWVLDGQHRIRAFRDWSPPDPYPVNVIIIKRWKGSDYEDVMRHQTYELNMGRPLSDDFKAAVREQYDLQVGHKEYKQEIALSWIRKDLESRGAVFSPNGIVGATNLRTPYVITMSFLESLIRLAFDHDPYLAMTYTLEKISPDEVKKVGKYLFDFYEGVRLSLGLINPSVKGLIGSGPDVNAAVDYWDIAKLPTKYKQRILHNVGLKGDHPRPPFRSDGCNRTAVSAGRGVETGPHAGDPVVRRGPSGTQG
ncbi:ParB N-terminal domain-containing protein [Mycobacterium asiaticum]|uniref:DNA sulfur modification protein DndB n=1 Tax=Mycobacterium asiaticum TaxID=1790 RepID=UPI0011DC7CAF|nr:DNA sulfur modification protein DndB [Mycobacterium asiaticum]